MLNAVWCKLTKLLAYATSTILRVYLQLRCYVRAKGLLSNVSYTSAMTHSLKQLCTH